MYMEATNPRQDKVIERMMKLEESNIEKAQILMKKYQERLESNKASYPELRWPDLRQVISEHQQEWGKFD
jgi:hypothetical protein